jgi:small subunit ribosomal protein S1
MTPRSPNDKDPLDSEVEAALEGVNLQDLDEQGRPPARDGRQGPGRGPRLWRGVVVGVSGDDVIVELGPRMQGVINASEFDQPGPEVGKAYDFTLHGKEEDELWKLSLREARALAAWDEVTVGALVEARVSGVNTGGLELRIGPVTAFMPASHVALERIEDLSTLLDQKLVCEVLEVERERKRVLLSRRAVLQREREQARQEAVGSLAVGAVLPGKVTRVEPFGAFVQIAPGLEGLLHVSNISHQRVEDPAAVLHKGQELQVKVLSIEEGGRRIGLGLKQLEPDPWQEAAARLSEGEVLTGKVVRLMDFGAFVELFPGVEGLVHVSQLKPDRVRRPSEAVTVGDEVGVRVLSVDPRAKRIALSRLDERGAVIGSEDSVEGAEIDRVLRESPQRALGTNLGNLFRKALDEGGGK